MIFIFFALFFFTRIYAKDFDYFFCEKGNLALPASQQPAPLIGFGQNIVDQNDQQLFLFADIFKGNNDHFIDVTPSYLYGIRDDWSIFFSAPAAVNYQVKDRHSTGMEDFSIQLEYAFFTRNHTCLSDQATVVANISIPTGSIHKNPPTGFGAPAFFIGATYNHMEKDWLAFTSYGAELPTWHHHTKFGNQYLYQFGYGRNIANLPGWIFDWMIELDGTFSEHNRIHGKIDPDSGGNVIYLTPSLWISSEKLIVQLGFGFAIQQHLFGHQNSNKYLLAVDMGWKF